MSLIHLPPAVKMLEVVPLLIKDQEVYFNLNSVEHREWIKTISKPEELLCRLSDNRYACLIQFLFVCMIAGFGGWRNPNLKHTRYDEQSLEIYWNGYMPWILSIGIIDEQMIRFVKQSMSVLFNDDLAEKGLDGDAFRLINKRFLGVQDELMQAKALITEAKLQVKIANKKQVPDPQVIFALLSALPLAELNVFYLKLSEFFDKNLKIEQSVLTPLNISQFFQFSSQDIAFVLEKIRLHFNLFFYGQDIQENQKNQLALLWDYLVERLKVDDVKQDALLNLENSLSLHIQSQEHLNTLAIRLLKGLK